MSPSWNFNKHCGGRGQTCRSVDVIGYLRRDQYKGITENLYREEETRTVVVGLRSGVAERKSNNLHEELVKEG